MKVTLIPNHMEAQLVKQFCPVCGYVENITKMQLIPNDCEDPNKPMAYVAWCPCGAVFNQERVLTYKNND